MDRDIIKIMQELQEMRQSYDVVFLGDISLTEIDPETGAKILIKKDIMVSIEKGLDDKPILKFYDENKNLMGVNINDGQGIQLVSNYYKMLNLPENRESLRELNKLSISKGKSLSNVQTELKQ